MRNPALEAWFGTPETITRLATSLEHASTELMTVKRTLDAQVSTLVPGKWYGTAASAFQRNWQEQAAAVYDMAQMSERLSSAMRTLGSELHNAKYKFQLAEDHATANRLYISPWFIVLPYSWTDVGAEAAIPSVQTEVWTSVGMASAARAQAAVELAALSLPASFGALRDIGQGITQWIGGFVQLFGGLANVSARIAPIRSLTSPTSYLEDLQGMGATTLNAAGVAGRKVLRGMEIMGRLSAERAEIDPEGFQRDVAKATQRIQEALEQPSAVIREGTKLTLDAGLVVATSGGGLVRTGAEGERLLAGGERLGGEALAGSDAAVAGERLAGAGGFAGEVDAAAATATAERVQAATDAVAGETGWTKQLGAAGEGSLLEGFEQRGVQAVDLNTMPSVGEGRNFRLFDTMSGDGFDSAKVKMGSTFDPDVPTSRLRAYRDDFQSILSEDKTMSSAGQLLDERNAGTLRSLQESGAWPRDLPVDATQDQIATYMRENGRLAIPEDHVGQVQDFLRQDMRTLPENYGLPANPTDAQIDQLLGRVRSNGISSSEIDRIVQPPYNVPQPAPAPTRP